MWLNTTIMVAFITQQSNRVWNNGSQLPVMMTCQISFSLVIYPVSGSTLLFKMTINAKIWPDKFYVILAWQCPLTSCDFKPCLKNLKNSTFSYLKLPPNPLLCCKVWANISYFLMSLSLTERRANLIASSKWSFLISGTGSSSSTSCYSQVKKKTWLRTGMPMTLKTDEWISEFIALQC